MTYGVFAREELYERSLATQKLFSLNFSIFVGEWNWESKDPGEASPARLIHLVRDYPVISLTSPSEALGPLREYCKALAEKIEETAFSLDEIKIPETEEERAQFLGGLPPLISAVIQEEYEILPERRVS